MRRRELILGLAAAVASPLVARAQQKPMPVIGFLSYAATNTKPAAFIEGLRQTGYIEGRNVRIEYRWADGDYARLPAFAADLVARKVDVIVTDGGNPEARAAKNATSTIPIIFIGSDPIENGFAASLARPGGNLTGIGSFETEITAKRLDLLSQLVPSAQTIGFLANPRRDDMDRIVREVGDATRSKGLEFVVANAAIERDLDTAFDVLEQHHADAFFEAGDAFFTAHRDRVVALAAEYKLPALYHLRAFVDAGGLISYGADFEEIYREEGVYAGRVLNGERPADLPVIQPTKFDLIINLKTAKALGLTVPQLLLARADEVIE